jgi:glyoxylase I family protein
MKNYLALAHASVLVRDTATALGFYCGVLDMPLDAARPDLGYPGAWLNLGAQQIHLLELPNPDPATGRPAHGGRDRHIAVLVRDLDHLKKRLEQAGIAHTLSRSGRRALFCRDPDGNALEFIETA